MFSEEIINLEKRIEKIKRHVENNKKDKKSLLAIQKLSSKRKRKIKQMSSKKKPVW
ncbi:30S ribosomal protein S15 [Candidatus Vidania fulgoroideae]|nr:30S ribosomal protein S15 [Candidatus Vidania fulgoroideae]